MPRILYMASARSRGMQLMHFAPSLHLSCRRRASRLDMSINSITLCAPRRVRALAGFNNNKSNNHNKQSVYASRALNTYAQQHRRPMCWVLLFQSSCDSTNATQRCKRPTTSAHSYIYIYINIIFLECLSSIQSSLRAALRCDEDDDLIWLIVFNRRRRLDLKITLCGTLFVCRSTRGIV